MVTSSGYKTIEEGLEKGLPVKANSKWCIQDSKTNNIVWNMRKEAQKGLFG